MLQSKKTIELQNKNASPIMYTVDGYLMSCAKDRDKQAQELVVALAETKNLSVFQAGYIQRFID